MTDPSHMKSENLRWRVKATVEKFRDGDDEPYETLVEDGNMLTYEGASTIWDYLIAGGNGTAAFNNANAHIGVGNGDDAEDPTQTDLQGSSTYYDSMEVGYPSASFGATSSDNDCTWKISVDTANGNFAWNEWGLFNHSAGGASGEMLNRKVVNFGTKTNSDTWTLTVTLSLS